MGTFCSTVIQQKPIFVQQNCCVDIFFKHLSRRLTNNTQRLFICFGLLDLKRYDYEYEYE